MLKRQPYPATAAKSGQVVAPFRVTMPISKDVLDFVGEKPRVGYWNPEDTEWQFEGITDVAYDAKNREISFSTVRLGELGLLQPRDALAKLKSWSLRPMYPDCFIVTICPEYVIIFEKHYSYHTRYNLCLTQTQIQTVRCFQ